MRKGISKASRGNLIIEMQSHFDFLSRASRLGLHGESSIACRMVLKYMLHALEVLERDQRRDLS